MAKTDERSGDKAADKPSSGTRVGGWVRSIADEPLSTFQFARSRNDVLFGGVAGGLGERWGVEPMLVRIGFVVLSYAGAVGVIAYLAAWFVSMEPTDRRAPKPREPSVVQGVSFGSMVLGTTLLLRSVGVWFGDALGVPLLIGAVGAAVVYLGTGRDRRPRRTRAVLIGETKSGRPSLLHLLIGGAFVIGGVTWFLTINRTFSGFLTVILAVGVTTLGLAIVFGPWVYRLANQLGEERRDRIRSEERSELAAHLHDSVLQTLALIQRNAGSPRKMAALARRQERELRAWLYGQAEIAGGIEAAVSDMAASIEEAHDVAVETVVVGDCPLDERTYALVQACREAATNAARHSGADEISVYIECEAQSVTAYVRDRGNGFELDAIPHARRGITDSIKGRIERHGGSVAITTSPGEGCEVQMTMPVGPQS
jgi:phage shock protein PspC (stress-responsive transcriptional regulator)